MGSGMPGLSSYTPRQGRTRVWSKRLASPGRIGLLSSAVPSDPVLSQQLCVNSQGVQGTVIVDGSPVSTQLEVLTSPIPKVAP